MRRNKLLVKLRSQPQVSAVFDSGSIRVCAKCINPKDLGLCGMPDLPECIEEICGDR